jgi:hypothetical protein
MLKIIRFFSKKDFHNLGQPLPTKRVLPEWYRKSETTIGPNKDSGLKRCIPFLDALLTGYVLVTPVDVFVSQKDNGELDIRWNSPENFADFIAERPKELGELMPRPAGHLPNHLAWRNVWGYKTPRGWSLLITHPLNRHDLPFTTTSGIMDTDKYSTSGNIPFFIKEGFSGVIPAGTPIAQLIPMKRARWSSIKNDSGISYLEDAQGEFVRLPGHSYKNFFWQKKEFN